MKRFNIIICALLFVMMVPFSSQGQEKEKENQAPAPGYMGRRCLLSADITANYFSVTNLLDSKAFHFPITYNVEYAIKRNASLMLSFTNQTVTTEQYYTPIVDAYGYEYHNIKNTTQTINTFVLSYRWYTGESIAPLGVYCDAGLVYNHVLTGDTVDLLIKSPRSVFGAQFGVGRHYLFFDRLLLNIGVKYTITAGLPNLEKINFETYPDDVLAAHMLNRNIWLTQVMMLNVGIGILPF